MLNINMLNMYPLCWSAYYFFFTGIYQLYYKIILYFETFMHLRLVMLAEC